VTLQMLQFFEKRHAQTAIDNWQSRPLGASKRVDDLQPLEPGEVAVSSDEFRNSVLEAESNNMSVVNQIARGARLAKDLFEY